MGGIGCADEGSASFFTPQRNKNDSAGQVRAIARSSIGRDRGKGWRRLQFRLLLFANPI